MPQTISLTALRSQLFNLVDQVISTGIPLEIERNGHKVKIICDEEKSKFSNLRHHDCIIGDPDDLVDLSTSTWDETQNI